MKIAFIDPSRLDYTIDTPYERPLGGSQSGMCYLAESLADLGHEVWLLNSRTETVRSRGVMVGSFETQAVNLSGFDVAVVLNGIHTSQAVRLRELAGPEPFLVYWTQHAHDQPAVGNLGDPAMRGVWDAYVLISEWQAGQFREKFDLPADRIRILRNAIGPAFSGREPDPPAWPPVLAYTSTPFRGLNILLEAFPRIREAVPGTTLKVFSSMGVYQVASENDPYAELYRICRMMEGVDYVGSLPQPRLAEALRGVAALAYPNTFPETSCIAVMEALASGCAVVTTELGALPETAGGWGEVIPIPDGQPAFVEAFAAQVIDTLEHIRRWPEQAQARRRQQVARINATTTWPVRAREWLDWLGLRLADRGGAAVQTPVARLPGDSRPLVLTRGRHGVFVGDTGSHEGLSLELYGEWLEPLTRILTHLLRPGDRVIQVGAGGGGLSVPIARRVGKDGALLSLSRTEVEYRLLSANLALNGLDWVTARQGVPGRIDTLTTDWPSCRLLMAGHGEDVPELLKGLDVLVRRHRPLFHLPIDRRAGEGKDGCIIYARLCAWARHLRYRLYWSGCHAFDPDNFLARRENLLGGAGFFGVLAVPAESPLRIAGQEEAEGYADGLALFPRMTGLV